MEKSLAYGSCGRNGEKPFFSLYQIRPVGWIFCSPEQSKLCFEALETRFCASKPLALAGSFKTLSEVEVLLNY